MALGMIEIYLSGGGGEWVKEILEDGPLIPSMGLGRNYQSTLCDRVERAR